MNYTGAAEAYHTYTAMLSANSHPITRNWFLIDEPLPLIAILVVYHCFCLIVGPAFMKDRQPFQLKNILIAYNLFNVVASSWMIYESLSAGWLNHYSYKCQPLESPDNPRARRMALASYVYFLCKLMELWETVFFVLRKKYNQVSFLHLYHHTLMPSASWMLAKFIPGGHSTLVIPLNSFVHVIMYGYYLMAALGPQYHKYLWWKKYLTTLQLVQFAIMFFHNLQIFTTDCDYPRWMPVISVVNSLYIFYLFSVFYIRTYRSKGVKMM